MWYTVAKKEFGWRKVGTVFLAKKDYAGYVRLFPVKYGSDKDGKTIPVIDPKNYVQMDSVDARRMCTRPTQDFDSVVEESIMICEGAYC